MKTKPKPKTCYSRRVVVYDIATGNRMEFPSVIKASAKVGACPSRFGEVLRSGMLINCYVCAYIEDEEKAIVKLANCQARGEYVKPQRKRSEKLVSLRIDPKTVIMVTPDKATAEYAAQWKAKHEADAKHTCRQELVDANNTLNLPKKRGGRQ